VNILRRGMKKSNFRNGWGYTKSAQWHYSSDGTSLPARNGFMIPSPPSMPHL